MPSTIRLGLLLLAGLILSVSVVAVNARAEEEPLEVPGIWDLRNLQKDTILRAEAPIYFPKGVDILNFTKDELSINGTGKLSVTADQLRYSSAIICSLALAPSKSPAERQFWPKGLKLARAPKAFVTYGPADLNLNIISEAAFKKGRATMEKYPFYAVKLSFTDKRVAGLTCIAERSRVEAGSVTFSVQDVGYHNLYEGGLTSKQDLWVEFLGSPEQIIR